jgi:polysaccharide export outer membrane protein
VASEYVIGPGDTLNIFVFRAPELSTDVPVRPDGRISLPLVQDIQAAGRTPAVLAREIGQRLREYVRDPNVTVTVKSFVGPTSRQVRVIGEATEPTAIAYRDGMTVLDVLIATRGLTRFAAGNRATIVRRDTPDGTQQVIPVRLSALVRDGDISQDIPLRPGDTLIIPQGWF